MDDYSTSVGEMQTQTDPGEQSSESQPTTLAGEVERLRYAINEIKKTTTYWYETHRPAHEDQVATELFNSALHAKGQM